jgi:hypothetical protein
LLRDACAASKIDFPGAATGIEITHRSLVLFLLEKEVELSSFAFVWLRND